MEVGISKSGLAVSVSKNANIAGAIQAMNIPKLVLQGKIEAFLPYKIQVNINFVEQKCGNIELSSKAR